MILLSSLDMDDSLRNPFHLMGTKRIEWVSRGRS